MSIYVQRWSVRLSSAHKKPRLELRHTLEDVMCFEADVEKLERRAELNEDRVKLLAALCVVAIVAVFALAAMLWHAANLAEALARSVR